MASTTCAVLLSARLDRVINANRDAGGAFHIRLLM
jgi:hypothetical protein